MVGARSLTRSTRHWRSTPQALIPSTLTCSIAWHSSRRTRPPFRRRAGRHVVKEYAAKLSMARLAGHARSSEWLLTDNLKDKSILARFLLRGLYGEAFPCQLPFEFSAVRQHGDGFDLGRIEAIPKVLAGVGATRKALDENSIARPAKNRGIENIVLCGETDILSRVPQAVHLVERSTRFELGGALAGDKPRGCPINGSSVDLQTLPQFQQALFGRLRNSPVRLRADVQQ